MSSFRGRRPVFGRLDPFCLLAAVPAVLVGVLMATQGLWLLGLGCVVFAGFILLFDSWANRPDPVPPTRPAVPVRLSSRQQASWAPPRRHVPHRPMRTVSVRPPR